MKVTPRLVFRAVTNNLFLHGLAVYTTIVYFRFPGVLTGIDVPLAFLGNYLFSLLPLQVNAFSSLRTVHELIDKDYSNCSLKCGPLSEYMRPEDLEDWLRAGQRVLGPALFLLFRNILDRTIAIEYDISYETLKKASLSGTPISYQAGAYAVTDACGYCYAFVPKGHRANVFLKFQLLHELGHGAAVSGVTTWRELMEPTVQATFLICASFTTVWEPLSIGIYCFLLIALLDEFGPTAQHLKEIDRLTGESIADVLAVSYLSATERSQLRDKLISSSGLFMDSSLGDRSSFLRRERLTRLLLGENIADEFGVMENFQSAAKLALVITLAFAGKGSSWKLSVFYLIIACASIVVFCSLRTYNGQLRSNLHDKLLRLSQRNVSG